MVDASGPVDPGQGWSLVGADFPSLREIGELSRAQRPQVGFCMPQGEGASRQCQDSMPWRNSVWQEDFISMGMYQIAKREEQEWRKKQAKEIREMLFRNQQPDSMRAAI
jgi:hypothetical protein